MQDDTQYSEEPNLEELKRKAREEETRRIEREAGQRSQDLAKSRLAKDNVEYQEELKAAELERRRGEEALKKQLDEISRKLNEERKKKEEVRRSEKEERERAEQEERRRREIEEQQRLEEEERRKMEAEHQRLEQVAKQQAEEQRRRDEEEIRRQEEERLRREKEQQRKEDETRRRLEEEIRRKEKERRKQIEEKENRIRSLIASAQVFFDNKEFENAAVEIAKALVNDPANPDALELEQKIRDAQGKTKTEEVVEKSKVKEVTAPKSRKEIQPRKKTLSTPLVVFTLLALVVGTIVFFQLKKRVFEKPVTFAVMPWKSSPDTDEDAVLGFSLAKEVVERFQHLPRVSVMGYSSAYGLASSVTNPDKAVFRLGYDYILEGTLTASDSGFSIELKLVDSLGGVKWAHRYVKSASGLATFSGEIAQSVAEALKIPIEGGNVQWSTHPSSLNADAYLSYLRGLEKLRHQTDQSTKDALVLFEKSIDLDGTFAEALIAAANVTMIRVEKGWNKENDALLQAQQWAKQAEEADASLGEWHQVLGRIMVQQRDFKSAVNEFDAALKVVPSNSDVFLNKAKVFLNIGKYDDAIDALNRAYDLNPRDPEILTTFAFAHQLKGSVGDGFWYHLTALFFVPDSTQYLVGPFANAIMFDPELSLSQSDRVADACQRRIKSNPDDYISLYRLARMLQVNGNALKADSILNSLEIILRKDLQTQPNNTDVMMYLALTLTRLGKYPETMSLANKALEIENNNANVKYKIAQMYSVQMYSQKKKEIDAKKKEEALKALREAVALNFQLEEISNADFYNLSGQAEFRPAIIRQPL